MSNKPKEISIHRLELPEIMFIGIPVNVSFKHGDFSKIGQLKQTFMQRRSEIPNIADVDHYYAPWYDCEVMFTYFYCMQVSSLEQIPEGMTGFAVPARTYLRAQYDGAYPCNPDPYAELQKYREIHNLRHDKSAIVIEKYALANESLEGRLVVEVYGPIES
ncbi:GyrI-like domain-containing protein [Paenibacillus pinihumi]|uniref:GyrI-like domain-containing protein n=1 Tax=Paenibacillus pinihumi TaxID=669462 RepID=UPI000423886D|nr:effector binding domain-containing protein [Paenibacillus pinihumi]